MNDKTDMQKFFEIAKVAIGKNEDKTLKTWMAISNDLLAFGRNVNVDPSDYAPALLMTYLKMMKDVGLDDEMIIDITKTILYLVNEILNLE